MSTRLAALRRCWCVGGRFHCGYPLYQTGQQKSVLVVSPPPSIELRAEVGYLVSQSLDKCSIPLALIFMSSLHLAVVHPH